MVHIGPERLIADRARSLTPQDVLARVEKFLGQVVGLEGIIIVGREGDPGSFRCRPTRGLPESRVREALETTLTRFETVAQADPFEMLIQIPGMRQLSFKETRERVGQFIATCGGATLVLICFKHADLGNLRFIRSANISNETARETVRRALISFKGGLPPPAT